MLNLDSLVSNYLEMSTTHRTIWIKDEGTPFYPEKEHRTTDEVKKHLAIALMTLDKYRASFRPNLDTHTRFLYSLRASFNKFGKEIDLSKLDDSIRQITTTVLQRYQNKIDWKEIPSSPIYDAVVLVGEKKVPFPVNCQQLTNNSEYFKSLLGGDFKENPQNDPIHLVDTNPETFKNYLKALYRAKYPADFDFLLDLGIFANRVGNQKVLSEVCKMLQEYAKKLLIDELLKKLKSMCLCDSIIKVFADVLAKDFHVLDLKKIQKDLLLALAKHDNIRCNELTLHLKINELLENRKFKKKYINELLHCVRYENLTMEEFLGHILLSPHISDTEKISFQKRIVSKDSDKRPMRWKDIVEVENLGLKKNIKIKILLSEDDLKFSTPETRRTIKRTEEFEIFDNNKWVFQIIEDFTINGISYHSVYLTPSDGKGCNIDFTIQSGFINKSRESEEFYGKYSSSDTSHPPRFFNTGNNRSSLTKFLDDGILNMKLIL